MPNCIRPVLIITALVLAASALNGCSSLNEKMAAGVGDYLPAWAGGLPADAPPRPETAKYDEFMKERERKRLMPAAERGDDPKAASTPVPTSQGAAH